MIAWLDRSIQTIASLAYPPACCFCDEPIAEADHSACRRCREDILATATQPVCPRCAAVVGPYFERGRDRCSLCEKESYAFERVFRLGRYEGLLAQSCRRLKKPSGFRAAPLLVEMLFERDGARLADLGISAVVPIPLHWFRRIVRGYDQAHYLAGLFAARLSAPLVAGAMVRKRATTAQVRLSPTRRRENVRDAFHCRRSTKVAGATILLVDDIMTTGATAHHAARALKKAGASTVHTAVLARGDHVRGAPSQSAQTF